MRIIAFALIVVGIVSLVFCGIAYKRGRDAKAKAGVKDRFTDHIRWVMYASRQEAVRLRHDRIDTEHLLLGIIRQGYGTAATVLANLGMGREMIRCTIEQKVPMGGRPISIDEPQFTPEAKRALELSVAEARRLGHTYVGTEHLLLGLSCEGTGVAARVLIELGAPSKAIADETLNVLANWAEFTDRRARPWHPMAYPPGRERP